MIQIDKTEDVDSIKSIPNHEDFKCTKDGEVIGKRGKPLVGHVDRCGYREVLLSENGVTKNYLVHRLILSTFMPIDNMDKYQINHKNGNKLDNRLDNLEWCTRSENIKHSYANGLQQKITNQHGTHRVLSQNDLDMIRDLHNKGCFDREIAEKIGCSRSLVSKKIREWGIRNDND